VSLLGELAQVLGQFAQLEANGREALDSDPGQRWSIERCGDGASLRRWWSYLAPTSGGMASRSTLRGA